MKPAFQDAFKDPGGRARRPPPSGEIEARDVDEMRFDAGAQGRIGVLTVRESSFEHLDALDRAVVHAEDAGQQQRCVEPPLGIYLQAHPDLARLVLWEGLADVGAVPDEPTRSALYQRKLEVIAEAQRNGVIDDSLEPAYLVFMLLALASWWTAQPQTARMLTGADPSSPRERTKRRAAVVDAALRLARPPLPR